VDQVTRKPVANITVYNYVDGDTHYRLTFQREQTILQSILADSLVWWKRILAWLVGFDGAYLRFTGQLTIDCYEGDKIVNSEKDEALWELMYFGHVRKP